MAVDDRVSSFLAEHAEDDVCRFVTVGRRTGKPHDIEIWFAVVVGEVALIAGNGPTCDWWQNAMAEPAVELRIGDRWLRGTARAAEGEARRRVGEAMGAKYGGWGGDPSIGLTEPAWVWDVPALLVGDLELATD
jgi:deazaflavin-dependent oxidoreductase (nitroreductase family)